MSDGAILIPVGPGELCDRLSILEIKAEKTRDGAAMTAAVRMRDQLRARRAKTNLCAAAERHAHALAALNRQLWEAEDAIRRHDAAGDFGPAFVALARRIHRLNDERAALKAEIDRLAGRSDTTETKIYAR